ncbi:hypothetical protein A2U01_0010013 [Trifolium medium]|uniref:Uncharacterized protein n=1 Tax=Trifolium medium TaxID=97028 RepID=A0A392MNN4_9FABA|nr:hypothetical protein [Trifolium medium]
MIKFPKEKGKLNRFTKEDNHTGSESYRGKSPWRRISPKRDDTLSKKTLDFVKNKYKDSECSDEDNEQSKGKRLFMASVLGDNLWCKDGQDPYPKMKVYPN